MSALAKATRAALYLRVSTADQRLENQRPELLQLAKARGFVVSREFEERESAAKYRPMLDALLEEARRGSFGVVLVWALDRLGRSMSGNIAMVLELDRLGVRLISIRETWLDTSGPIRDLLIAIFSWVAEQERTRLIERTKAGIAAARKRGVQIGRRRRYVDIERAHELASRGKSLRFIADELDIGLGTLHRALAVGASPPRTRCAPEKKGAPKSAKSVSRHRRERRR